MKWLYALLVIVVLWLAVDTKAEFSSGRSASTPGSTRFIDQDHLVQLSESGVFEVIAPDTLEFTATFYVNNRSSEKSFTGITLTDSLGQSIDSDLYQLVVVDAPSKVAGPATVTANGSWTGYEGATQLLDGSNSLGPREAMTISYKVRFIADWFQGDWAYFDIGPHLGGSVGAGEINGSNDLGFGIPWAECENLVQAFQVATPLAGNGSLTTIEFQWYIANPNPPGCVGVEPICTGDIATPIGPSGNYQTAVVCTLDNYILAPSTYVLSDGLTPRLIDRSEDNNGDGFRPTVAVNPDYDGSASPEGSTVAVITNLGPQEWVYLSQSIDITHGGVTAWGNRIWALCGCDMCETLDVVDADTTSFLAFPAPQIAGRMTVGTPVVDGSGYAMPCSVFVKNTGGDVIEKINSHWILADAFPTTSELSSVTGLASKLFTVNSSFNGDDNDSLLTGDPADELAVGEVDTLTFTANFEEGDQTSWSSKASVNCEPDGGGAAEIDTTNCGPDYGEGDGEPNEDGDNAACAWSISAASSRLEIADLTYEGAFILPKATIGTHSAGACAWYPEGDDSGNGAGYPGTLIVSATNNSGVELRKFAEVSIPEPLITNDLDALPIATLISGPKDLGSGRNFSDCEVYYTGSEWRLWTANHNNSDHNPPLPKYQHYLATMPFSGGTVHGPWAVDGAERLSNETNWYSFQIDSTWASLHSNGRRIAVGRYSEGRGHQGPNLYAFSPLTQAVGDLPSANTNLPGSTLLMQWGERDGDDPDGENDELEDQEDWVQWHASPDFYNGGAWIAGTKQAVLMSLKNKCYGQWWYGWQVGVYPNAIDLARPEDAQGPCSDDNVCEALWASKAAQWAGPVEGYEIMVKDCCDYSYNNNPNCPVCPGDGGNRGPCADRYSLNGQEMGQELLFFDPDEIALIAHGLMDSKDLQPYARFGWRQYMFKVKDPGLTGNCHMADWTGQGGFEVGGSCAWIPSARKLFVTEYLGSCSGSGGRGGAVIHVWSADGTSP